MRPFKEPSRGGIDMRAAFLLALTVLLAGCAQAPAEDEAGEQTPAPAYAGTSCAPAEVVVGFDEEGAPRCRHLIDVFSDAWEGRAERDPSDPAGWTPPPGWETPPPSPAKTVSLASAGALRNETKSYVVASASQGLRWSDLAITIDGAQWPMGDASCAAPEAGAPGAYQACSGSVARAGEDGVMAGDEVTLVGVRSGQTLRILDREANSVILTLVVA